MIQLTNIDLLTLLNKATVPFTPLFQSVHLQSHGVACQSRDANLCVITASGAHRCPCLEIRDNKGVILSGGEAQRWTVLNRNCRVCL